MSLHCHSRTVSFDDLLPPDSHPHKLHSCQMLLCPGPRRRASQPASVSRSLRCVCRVYKAKKTCSLLSPAVTSRLSLCGFYPYNKLNNTLMKCHRTQAMLCIFLCIYTHNVIFYIYLNKKECQLQMLALCIRLIVSCVKL